MKKRKTKHIVKTFEEWKLEYLPQAYKEEILNSLTLEEHVEYFVRRDIRRLTKGKNPTDTPKTDKIATLEKIDRILDK